MRIVYIADDGKEFDNKYDCEEYEWIINHPSIHNVKLYDNNGHELMAYMSQDSYENADLIIVQDNAALESLHELASLTGFCYYYHIKSPGTWEFKMDGCDGRYIKVEDTFLHD